MKRIRKPKAGDPISARHIGDIVDAATRVNNVTFGRGFDVRNDQGGLHVQLRNDPQQEQWTLCKIVEEGPDAEPDYTDERYWVREVYCQNAAGDTHARMSFNTFAAGGEPFYGTATNLGEIGLPAGNQHQLLDHYDTFTVVMVYSVWDNTDPPNAHHYFMGGGCPDVIRADGMCYICSWEPDSNFGGHEVSHAYLDTTGDEMRILIHFALVPNLLDTLLVFEPEPWLRALISDPWSSVEFRLYRITEDFDPCTVTWNTRPASALHGQQIIGMSTTSDNGYWHLWGSNSGIRDTSALGWGLSGVAWQLGATPYGFEIRVLPLDLPVTSAGLHISNFSPLLLMPGLIPELECPGVTSTEPTASTSTTPTTSSTTTPTTTSTTTTTTPTTTSTTTGTTSSTTSHTTTTEPPVTTLPPVTTIPPIPSTTTTTTITTSSTTTVTTTSANPCVCCPGDTPDQMDVTISGLGAPWCEGQDNGTWRLDLLVADEDQCGWVYSAGGRGIGLGCTYNEILEEYIWTVSYSRGDCSCEWQGSFAANECDGASISPPYAGSCMDNGGGTASWTPVA